MQSDKGIRAAFVTQSGEKVDAGFEQAPQIVICEISTTEVCVATVLNFERSALQKKSCVTCKHGKNPRDCKKNKEGILNELEVDARVAALEGVSVLFTVKTLNAFSALALNCARIFPVKLDEPHRIADLSLQLQEMLMWNPPPWLRRAMNESERERSGIASVSL